MADANSKKAKILADFRESLTGKYPELRAVLENGTIFVRGSFPVIHNGELLDRFQIEVLLPNSFPNSVPALRETAGRIPHRPDRHVNAGGEACPIVPEEWLLQPAEQRTLLGFLDGPVRNFFVGQALVEQGLPWPAGERLHGRTGLIQAYGEILGISDTEAIPRYLDCLSHQRIKGHWDCPCGGGKKLRHCHLNEIKELQKKVPRFVAQSAFDRLRDSSGR